MLAPLMLQCMVFVVRFRTYVTHPERFELPLLVRIWQRHDEYRLPRMRVVGWLTP